MLGWALSVGCVYNRMPHREG